MLTFEDLLLLDSLTYYKELSDNYVGEKIGTFTQDALQKCEL